jgi:LysM repeat protein
MDTISRENNTSYLPFAGLIAGVIALILAVVGLVQVSKLKAANLAFQEEQTAKVAAIEATATAANTASEGATRSITALQRSTQEAFGQVAGEITRINGEIVKIQEAAAKPKVSAKTGGPAVAGPDEYVIVGGDTGAKIARAKGVSLADLIAVNSGVNWSGLKVGQKIKLPVKK